MDTWRRWPYLRALLRVSWRTGVTLLAAGLLLSLALLGLSFFFYGGRGRPVGAFLFCSAIIFGIGGLVCLREAIRVLRGYFRPPGRDSHWVWEWPSEIVRREEQERREAKKGTELIAGAPPEGTGTELESGTAPEGRGTELAAGEDADQRPPTSRERA